MAEPLYDLVVIGAGSAGIPAAQFAAAIGARVLLVEADLVGGDCTWTGCIPSKALLQAAAVAQTMRGADRHGIAPAQPQVDLGQVMDRVREASLRVYEEETPEKLQARGVEVLIGHASFEDENTLRAGDRLVTARRFLVCTGAEPALPSIAGLDQVDPLTYLSIYDLRRLPDRLAVLGGGATGCELAQAFQRLGSQVTLLEVQDRLLPVADPEASRLLQEQFEEEGMAVVTGATARTVRRKGTTLTVELDHDQQVEADRLLVATSRRPRLHGLNLGRAGVEVTQEGIRTDDHLRTSRDHIYAAGDVTGGPQFTHYAGWQGFHAARNALLPAARPARRSHVPWAVFTDPEVAHAGPSRQEAEQDHKTEVHRLPLARLDRAQARGDRRGYLEILTQDGVVVAATCVTAAGGEVINELALAIERKLKLSELGATIHAYPTFGFGLQQLGAEAAVARALSGISGRFIRTLVR